MNNKGIFMLLVMAVLLAACGSKSSWETEQVAVASTRLMADMVEAKWNVQGDPGTAKTGEKTLIRLEITQKDGKPVEKFDITHEKLLHLIVISKDLAYFNHIHPEYKGNGVFEISNDFPAGGEYRFIADFKPTDGDSMTKMKWIKVAGEAPTAHKAAPATPTAAGSSLVDVASGKQVNLSIDGLTAYQETKLTFTIKDEATGEPVTNLEPYLGAIGHVVVLSEDGERYLHVHAEEDQGMGPEAKFETSFPRTGLYKVWGQFQQNNQVFTVSYRVNVQ